MTGRWGTRAHHVHTGGNPLVAQKQVGVSFKHPEFTQIEAKEVLALLEPVRRQKKRRPRSSNKIKKVR